MSAFEVSIDGSVVSIYKLLGNYSSVELCFDVVGLLTGLVGSAYHMVAFQPDSAMQAVQRATSGTVTMGMCHK